MSGGGGVGGIGSAAGPIGGAMGMPIPTVPGNPAQYGLGPMNTGGPIGSLPSGIAPRPPQPQWSPYPLLAQMGITQPGMGPAPFGTPPQFGGANSFTSFMNPAAVTTPPTSMIQGAPGTGAVSGLRGIIGQRSGAIRKA